MTEAVVFDTSALPMWRGLGGPLWLSILKLCNVKGVAVALPEIVVLESVNLRSDRFSAASAKFLASQREVSRFFDIEGVYVPDAEQVAQEWEEELRASFSVVEIDGEDAAEALKREVQRTRPARLGRGARDSAIWMTVLRLSKQYDIVTFVSNNTKDFAVGPEKALHPDLLADVAATGSDVRFVSTVEAVVDALAMSVGKPTFDVASIADILRADVRDAASSVASEDTRYRGISADQVNIQDVQVTAVDVLRSYSIEEQGLALISGTGSIPLGNTGDGEAITFTFGAWIDFDVVNEEAIAGELHDLRLP